VPSRKMAIFRRHACPGHAGRRRAPLSRPTRISDPDPAAPARWSVRPVADGRRSDRTSGRDSSLTAQPCGPCCWASFWCSWPSPLRMLPSARWRHGESRCSTSSAARSRVGARSRRSECRRSSPSPRPPGKPPFARSRAPRKPPSATAGNPLRRPLDSQSPVRPRAASAYSSPMER